MCRVHYVQQCLALGSVQVMCIKCHESMPTRRVTLIFHRATARYLNTAKGSVHQKHSHELSVSLITVTVHRGQVITV
jgi:hypothetical protein